MRRLKTRPPITWWLFIKSSLSSAAAALKMVAFGGNVSAGYMASGASPPVSRHPAKSTVSRPEVCSRIQEEAPQVLPSIKITQNPLPLFAVLRAVVPGGLTPVAFWVMAYEDLQRQEKRRRSDFHEKKSVCSSLHAVTGHAHPQRDATRRSHVHTNCCSTR